MFEAVGFEADIFPLLGAQIGMGAVFSFRRKSLTEALRLILTSGKLGLLEVLKS